MLEQVVEFGTNLHDADPNGFYAMLGLASVGAVSALAVFGVLMRKGIKGIINASGDRKMRRKQKEMLRLKAAVAEIMSESFREVIEDKFCCELDKAVVSNRISIDDARVIYARYANLGFWGLHPRKYSPPKTGLDLTELKERLTAKWRPDRLVVINGVPAQSAPVQSMLEGLTEALRIQR